MMYERHAILRTHPHLPAAQAYMMNNMNQAMPFMMPQMAMMQQPQDGYDQGYYSDE